jgi:pimeloyl-ACP methyl ester carboxylesterase
MVSREAWSAHVCLCATVSLYHLKSSFADACSDGRKANSMHGLIANTPYGSIEYRLEGNGPVVMVLNGGHCSRDTRLSHERLTHVGFTVLTPSRPGYDDTPATVGRSAQAAADAMAALLDRLGIAQVSAIGISAAGPTALAFAQRHPERTRGAILESAVTTPWDETVKRGARLAFGRMERLTWAMVRLGLRLSPRVMLKAMLSAFTTLNADDVLRRMSQDDIAFFKRMLQTMRSGNGFVNDLEHRVDDLHSIQVPVLAIYSPHDKSVPPSNAQRIACEVAGSELFETPADTHLIWIGSYAEDVWQKRRAFLQACIGGLS